MRFAFGFAVSIAAGIIVATAGPVFGGMFLAFPAILPATTTLLERRNGLAQASEDVRGATVGALGMVAFAWVAWVLFRRTSPGVALLVCDARMARRERCDLRGDARGGPGAR